MPTLIDSQEMKKRIQIAFVLMLGGGLGTAFWFTLGAIQRIFDLRIEVSVFWLIGTTGIPMIIGSCLMFPKLVLFLAALAVPFGSALVGAVTGYEIWNEWYFWPVTVICAACMAYVLFDSLKERTIQSAQVNPCNPPENPKIT